MTPRPRGWSKGDRAAHTHYEEKTYGQPHDVHLALTASTSVGNRGHAERRGGASGAGPGRSATCEGRRGESAGLQRERGSAAQGPGFPYLDLLS